MIIGIIVLILIRWRFNVLAMGEEEADGAGSGYREIADYYCRLLHHDYRFFRLYQRHHRLGRAGHPPRRPRHGGA